MGEGPASLGHPCRVLRQAPRRCNDAAQRPARAGFPLVLAWAPHMGDTHQVNPGPARPRGGDLSLIPPHATPRLGKLHWENAQTLFGKNTLFPAGSPY